MTGMEGYMEGRSRHQEFIKKIFVGAMTSRRDPVCQAMRPNEDEMSDLLDELLKNYMNDEN